MNVAVILSGGTGTRMNLSIPKQYVEVCGKPIIGYSLETFQRANSVDRFVIVCHESWREYLSDFIRKSGLTKFVGFANSGESRQESVLNGLTFCKSFAKADDVVLLHDAARPQVTEKLIDSLLDLGEYDGKLPVIPVKDTIYYSENGSDIHQLLHRDALFAGQAPESFVFGKYLSVNESVSEEELRATRGSSEIAFRHGMRIGLIPGDENNYKITTPVDLEKFQTATEGK